MKFFLKYYYTYLFGKKFDPFTRIKYKNEKITKKE